MPYTVWPRHHLMCIAKRPSADERITLDQFFCLPQSSWTILGLPNMPIGIQGIMLYLYKGWMDVVWCALWCVCCVWSCECV